MKINKNRNKNKKKTNSWPCPSPGRSNSIPATDLPLPNSHEAYAFAHHALCIFGGWWWWWWCLVVHDWDAFIQFCFAFFAWLRRGIEWSDTVIPLYPHPFPFHPLSEEKETSWDSSGSLSLPYKTIWNRNRIPRTDRIDPPFPFPSLIYMFFPINIFGSQSGSQSRLPSLPSPPLPPVISIPIQVLLLGPNWWSETFFQLIIIIILHNASHLLFLSSHLEWDQSNHP